MKRIKAIALQNVKIGNMWYDYGEKIECEISESEYNALKHALGEITFIEKEQNNEQRKIVGSKVKSNIVSKKSNIV